MRLAIVIACRNQLEYTKLCLESLVAHTAQPWGVVLVDNESTDGTAHWCMYRCQSAGVSIDVIECPGTNLSRCWNLGIRQALANGAELVAVINNDTVVGPGWSEVFREHFRADAYMGRDTWLAVPDTYGGNCPGAGFDADLASRAGRSDYLIAREWFGGYFMVFRASALDDLARFVTDPPFQCPRGHLEFFDESYRIWYGDTEMRLRLNAAGRPAVMLMGTSIVHFGSKTTGGVPAHQAIIAQDRARFREKYGFE